MRLRAEDDRVLRIAHRGAAALAAENSLAAIEAGLAADVDRIQHAPGNGQKSTFWPF